jgi:hypothetical protein
MIRYILVYYRYSVCEILCSGNGYAEFGVLTENPRSITLDSKDLLEIAALIQLTGGLYGDIFSYIPGSFVGLIQEPSHLNVSNLTPRLRGGLLEISRRMEV